MRWPRLVAGLILVGGLAFGLLGGEYSTLDWWTLKQEIRDERAEIERLRREIDSLAAWAEAVESDSATQERVAREKLGMLRDGEHVYFVVPVER